MKKIFTLLFFSLFFLHSGLAQNEYAQINLSNLKLVNSSIGDIIPVVDEAGLVCFSAVQGNIINFALVSPAGEVVVPPTAALMLTPTPEIMGAVASAEYFTFYSRAQGGNYKLLTPLQVNKETGQVTKLPAIVPAVEQKSKYVTSFFENNMLYLIFFSKKDKLLQVCRFKDGKHHDVRNYTIDFPKAGEYFSKKDWIFLNDESDKTVFSGHHKRKIYKSGNQLAFVSDAFPIQSADLPYRFTQLVSLDLAGEEASFKTFWIPRTDSDRGYVTYYNQNKLFSFTVNAREFKLDIYDAASQDLLKSYHYAKEEPITIKASPIYSKNTGSLSDVVPDESLDTKDILRKLAKGSPAVTVEQIDENTLQVTLGSYLVPSSGGGGAMMPMGGGTFSTPGGVVPVAPTYMYVGYGGFYGNGAGISTYFMSCLDAGTLEKAHTTVVPGRREQVEAYKDQLYKQDIKIGFSTVVKNSDKLFYTYLDRKAKLLKIVTFDI